MHRYDFHVLWSGGEGKSTLYRSIEGLAPYFFHAPFCASSWKLEVIICGKWLKTATSLHWIKSIILND